MRSRGSNQPTLAELLEIYRAVEKAARKIKRGYSNDLFDTRPFKELVLVANNTAHKLIASLTV